MQIKRVTYYLLLYLRADIANMVGTTYETVIRTLANFEKLNYIELVGKEIAIKDISKLKRISS
jgi:CRP-like cAMP-binding protein